jgi:EF-P beta-lysylation protein EpmB
MIPLSAPSHHPTLWQRLLSEAYSDPAALLEALSLPLPPPAELAQLRAAAVRFGLRVPRGFVARMTPGDPTDPLLLQVLPQGRELLEVPGYVADPVGDLAVLSAPGLLHKYRGRRLLITTGACAVHCRYCFRREFPYSEANAAAGGWAHTLAKLRADHDANEVLLSGGDPLSLSDRKLAQLVAGLAAMPHVARLRLHTRTPIVLPERVDDALCAWLSAFPRAKTVVLHANHAREFSPAVVAACARLRSTGAVLFNQAVLLRGINDTVDAQAALAETGFAAGVVPYYLNQLDPVRGAAHFAVSDASALQLHAALVERLPGYLVPKLVRDVPGTTAKQPLHRLAEAVVD